MNGINNQDSHDPVDTPNELPSSQNIPTGDNENGESTTAKWSMYASYVAIVFSLIVGFQFYQSRHSNELLAGAGWAMFLGLLVFINFVILLVHIIRAKYKNEVINKRAVILFVVPIIIYAGGVNIAGAIAEFEDSRPPSTGERKPLSKKEQAVIQEAAKKYQQKKIDTLQKYGFYYLTDDSNHIEKLKLDYFLYIE